MAAPRLSLILSPAQRAELAGLAEAAFPAECCGLLVGKGQRTMRVEQLVPARNLLAIHPKAAFELDPRTRIEVERQLRGSDLRILGHWHSHPDGGTRPSKADLEQAFEPEMVWLILGVAADPLGRPQTVGMAAHRLDRERGMAYKVRLDVP